MQIGNQRSKPCSSLISAKRAQLLTSPFPLSCDHPTSLGLPMCCRVAPSSRLASWPPGPLGWPWGGRCIQGQAFCLHVVSFSSDILESNSCCGRERSPQQCPVSAEGRRKGRVGVWMGQGGGRAVRGLCGDFGDGEDAGRRLPLPLLRDLAWFRPCMVAPGGSGQSLRAPGKSVVGSVAWGQTAGSG